MHWEGHVLLSLEIRVEFRPKIIKKNGNIWVDNIEINLTWRSTFCCLYANGRLGRNM
jgi:hypothetical protein